MINIKKLTFYLLILVVCFFHSSSIIAMKYFFPDTDFWFGKREIDLSHFKVGDDTTFLCIGLLGGGEFSSKADRFFMTQTFPQYKRITIDNFLIDGHSIEGKWYDGFNVQWLDTIQWRGHRKYKEPVSTSKGTPWKFLFTCCPKQIKASEYHFTFKYFEIGEYFIIDEYKEKTIDFTIKFRPYLVNMDYTEGESRRSDSLLFSNHPFYFFSNTNSEELWVGEVSHHFSDNPNGVLRLTNSGFCDFSNHPVQFRKGKQGFYADIKKLNKDTLYVDFYFSPPGKGIWRDTINIKINGMEDFNFPVAGTGKDYSADKQQWDTYDIEKMKVEGLSLPFAGKFAYTGSPITLPPFIFAVPTTYETVDPYDIKRSYWITEYIDSIIVDGIVLWKGLQKNVDYEIIYNNNVKVGIATFTIKGKGIWKGELQGHFTITPTI